MALRDRAFLRRWHEGAVRGIHRGGASLGDSLPDGQVFHAAGPSAGGWTIVAIHDSKESWERFRDGKLMPEMQAGIAGGFATPPMETAFEVYNQQP